mmetsp:Transcript_55448/g.96894  ORF Transcript_55448/g.96894 Transcript_55448/m.96894 type:complete len:89 (+) Transcript_55448:38-304(+)
MLGYTECAGHLHINHYHINHYHNNYNYNYNYNIGDQEDFLSCRVLGNWMQTSGVCGRVLCNQSHLACRLVRYDARQLARWMHPSPGVE